MKHSYFNINPVCSLLLLLILCLIGPSVWAASYTFVPDPLDLGDLPHGSYYAWGIEWPSVPAGEVIDNAVLHIDNINDWTMEFNDVLHIWMVDELPDVPWGEVNWPGVSEGQDGAGVSDMFADCGGTHLMDYTDYNWWWEDLYIPLPADKLQEYISNDGMFGLALDPDCHYYNKGLSLYVTTSQNPVPEPLTVLGVFAGVSAIAGYVRKRKLV